MTNDNDAVSHPSHYNQGKFEVIEFLEDQFGDRPHEWNAAKYLCRAPHKGNELQDLEKAAWYIRRKIALLKAKEMKTEPPRPNDMPNPVNGQDVHAIAAATKASSSATDASDGAKPAPHPDIVRDAMQRGAP